MNYSAKNFMFKFSIFIVLLYLLPACEKEKSPVSVFYGTEQPMGDGTIKSFIETDETGAPVSLGVTFTDAALQNLPTGFEFGYSYTLDLPVEVKIPPYNHISCDWNEHGHPPMGVYNVPHFDFHNYFISLDERAAIKAEDSLQFANHPLDKYIPEHYEAEEGGIPNMGGHFVDVTSGEFNDQKFDYTFIFGNYDAQVIFIEPMITLEVFKSKKDVSIPITQPKAWQKSGYYPQNYHFYYDTEKDSHIVVMENMVWHDAQ